MKMKLFNIALVLAFFSLASVKLSAQDVQQILGTAVYPVENVDYFLQNVGSATKGSTQNGCHSQGIKFDGNYFYSTCMDTNGSNTAHLYVHDKYGNLIKKFGSDSTYDHPSGIFLYNGWAYTGFTHNGLNMYSYLYKFNGTGTVQNQGFFDHSVGFVGQYIAYPNSSSFQAKNRYYSYDQYYERQCLSTDGTCGSYTDYTTGNNINSTSADGVQDCDVYYKNGGWYKACILFSSNPIKIRVWKGSQLRLAPDNAIITFQPGGLPGHSGGFGFYTDPSGAKWIVTTPPPAVDRRYCQGCTLVGGNTCACTDKSNRQRIRFYSFNKFSWPSGPN